MRTYLTFNTKKVVRNLNSTTEFYDVLKNKNNLYIIKKYKKRKGRPFSVVLPKQFKILPETVGLIIGEGFIGERHFVFANSNEKAISKVLEFLNQFGLPIRSYLEISIKNKSKEFIINCINFWKAHLGIHIDKVRLRKEFNSIAKYGTIHVGIYNTLVAKLLRQTIIISKKRIEDDKNLSLNYLKGVLAAEGNVNIKKQTNCVYMVRISASKQEERDHYKKCLEKVGVKIYCKDMPTISKQEARKKGWKTKKGRGGAVIISRWDNFLKIILLDLLELHDEKKEKLAKYFVHNKFTKQFFDFESFIGRNFTMKEAQNKFRLKGKYLDRVLTMLNRDYISRSLIDKKEYAYKLTPKYIKTYNKLQKELAPFFYSNS